ncbi:MAG: LPXTG cell wall anchor domain-containing protein [Pseudonocardia sp.]|nr:LPXTG cell wall anchor domain-containing protein [Pseudonocardia sp.]
MMRIVVALLVLWLAFVVVGFVFKTLLWLVVVGLVLFAGTAAYGAIRRRNAAIR